MESFDKVLQDIENLIDIKIEQKINEQKLNVESYGSSLSEFERMYMSDLEGNEYVSHVTLRSFIRYQKAYNDYRFNTDTATVLSKIKYLTPQPAQSLNEGEIPAIVQNLVLSGAGVKPTINADPALLPNAVAFNYDSNLVKGQFAYNEDDDIWYYRGKNSIKSLNDVINTVVTNAIAPTQQELSNVSQTVSDLNSDYAAYKISTAQEISSRLTRTDFDNEGVKKTFFESYQTQTAEEISARLTRTDFDNEGVKTVAFESYKTQTAQEISSRLTRTEFDNEGVTQTVFSSFQQQTADMFLQTVTQEVYNQDKQAWDTYSSKVEQTSTKISLLLNENNTLNAAFVLEQINSQSEAYLLADKIRIDGTTTFSQALARKSNNFTVQPTTPYYKGDTWFYANTIYTCQVTRLEGVFVAADWSAGITAESPQTVIDGGLITTGGIRVMDNGPLNDGTGAKVWGGLRGVGVAYSSTNYPILFWLGHETPELASFSVKLDGSFMSTSATIGGWTVDSDSIYAGEKHYDDGYNTDGAIGLTLSSDGSIHSKNFYINSDGSVGIRGNLKTAETGKRVEINSYGNNIKFFSGASAADDVLTIDSDMIVTAAGTLSGIRFEKPDWGNVLICSQGIGLTSEVYANTFEVNLWSSTLYVKMKNLPAWLSIDSNTNNWKQILVHTISGQLAWA